MNGSARKNVEPQRFKLIPDWDRNEKIISACQAFWGKAILSLLFSTIVCSFNFIWSWERAFVVAAILFLPLGADLKLLTTTAYLYVRRGPVFTVMSENIVEHNSLMAKVSDLNSQLTLTGAPLHLLEFISFAIFAYAVAAILSGRAKLRRHALLWLFLFWLALVAAAQLSLQNVNARHFLAVAFMNFSLSFFAIHFVIQNKIFERHGSRIERMSLLLQNLFTSTIYPFRRRSVFGADQARRQNETEAKFRAVQQIKAFKLLLASRLVLFAGELVDTLVFKHTAGHGTSLSLLQLPSLNWSNYLSIGFQSYNSLPTALWQRWSCVLLNCFINVTFIAGFGGRVVAYLRLFGLALPRPVYRVFEATDFNDYYKRLLYYYCKLLADLFFFRTWDWLRRLHLRPEKHNALAITASVFLGSYLAHLIWESNSINLIGASATVVYFSSKLPYCALLAIACGLSSLRNVDRPTPKLWKQSINIAGIFLTHSILLCLIDHSAVESWSARLQFMQSLLGLSTGV